VKVFGLPVGDDGCGYYRCYQPLTQLRRMGHYVMLPTRGMVWLPEPETTEPGGIGVMAGQLLTGPKGMAFWESWQGKTALSYDLDDDVFSSDHEGSLWHKMPECRDIAAYLLSISDLVTVSTEPLVDVVRKYNPHVEVLRNCVHEDLLAIERPRPERVTVGWAGGTSHLRDFDYVAPMLSRFLNQNPQVGMHFIGGDYTPRLKVPDGRTRHTKWTPDVWDYYRGVDFDVGIAPLDPAGKFNRCKCVDSSMRISTNRGMLEAGSLKPGMKVWRDGWRKIEAVEKNAPKPGLLITMESGYQLKLTAEHRMMVNGDWIQADAIVPGDRIAMEAESVGPTQYLRVPWPADSRKTRGGFNAKAFLAATDGPKLEITPRWGRLLGAFVGDGSCGQSTQIQISCDGQDQDWIDLLMADLHACGFQAHTETITQYDGTPIRRRGIRVASAHLLRVLESLGLTRSRPTGQPIRVARVPDVIWESPGDVIAEFLAGYFEADGTCTQTGVQVTSKDEQLIRDVQRLLLGFGITSTVRNRIHSAQNGHSGLYWHCSLRRAETDLFAKHIGFRSGRKSQRLAEITGKRHSNAFRPITWSRLVALVQPCMVTPVDIQVEGSTFVLAGFVSHNSHLKAMEYGALGIPVVASAGDAYGWYVEHGVTGFLVKHDHEWGRYLRALVNDEAMRAEMGAAGKKLAAQWTIQGHGQDWEKAYAALA
jgi:hypothetical protein